MRRLWGLLAGGLLIYFVSGMAAADSTAVITVHANVPVSCYIILSSDNQISEIITNSQQQVKPEVYYGNISPAHRAHLTAAIYTQYLLLIRHHHGQIGIVYRFSPHTYNRQPNNDVAYKPQTSFIHKLVLLKSVGSLLHD